jgi:2-keto-4-pentenoate hydratase/2-oxohepta-3-ene-1,7-dioic acid hydratase in catechol pathway
VRVGTVDGRLVLVTGPVADGRVDACQVVDVATASAGEFGPDPLDGFDRWPELVARAPDLPSGWPGRSGRLRLGPPVPRPRQVFAVALNYPPHAAEGGYRLPDQPLVFTKFPSCITGPAATVELCGDRVDWEVELVAVIGRPAYRVPEPDAWRYVAGLTVGQDLSDRALQMAGSPPQFSLGKSFPGAGPTGPVLVTPDELDDPDDLELSCALDQTTRQRGRTSEMIFSVPGLVARLSAACRLLPGDLIFTGTPSGVGNRLRPPRYLRPGERLTSRVEGIGEITTDFERSR